MNTGTGAQQKSTEHDVYAMLQQNRAFEQRAGLNEVKLRPVKSRRRRDFWLVLAVADTAFILTGIVARHNTVVLVYAIAGFAILTLGLTWVMWFVMDDY